MSKLFNGGKQPFSTDDSGTTGYLHVKNRFAPLAYTLHKKATYNGSQSLNVRAKPIKALEQNIGVNIFDLGKGFLKKTLEAKELQ